MAVSRFLDLVQPISATISYFTHSHSNVESVTQVDAKFLCEFCGARRQQVNILAHARLWHIGIDSLRAKNDCIIASAQKFQNRLLDGRKRQGFVHDELLKGKRTCVKHEMIVA